MNRKREIKVFAVVFLIGMCIAAGIRISSHYRNFGLPQDVISGEKTATAEATVRLYLLYLNRNDEQGIQSIQTDSRNRSYPSADSEYDMLDVRLLELRELSSANTSERETKFYTEYNYSSFWAPWWKCDSTVVMEFTLIKEGGKWKIAQKGNG